MNQVRDRRRRRMQSRKPGAPLSTANSSRRPRAARRSRPSIRATARFAGYLAECDEEDIDRPCGRRWRRSLPGRKRPVRRARKS